MGEWIKRKTLAEKVVFVHTGARSPIEYLTLCDSIYMRNKTEYNKDKVVQECENECSELLSAGPCHEYLRMEAPAH